jgi:DNA-binding NarL/FixJ family response regulator
MGGEPARVGMPAPLICREDPPIECYDYHPTVIPLVAARPSFQGNPMPSIRLLIVDDQALFREGLRTLLSVQSGLEVVGEAGNGEEALRRAAVLRPDVVLMDLQMPVMDGAAATRRLKAQQPAAKVIVLTTFDDDENVFEGLRAGAVGYLLKDTPSAKLVEAIRLAARGESFLEPSVAAKVVSEFARLAPRPAEALPDPLSEREIEVLRLAARGASNKEIAAELVIAEGTVKNHLTNILAKLGAADRTEAAVKAKELGLI